MTRERRVTIVDVAARAGVNAAVVSRVLSKDSTLNVRDVTRERVLLAAQELSYRPNAAARSLRTSRTSTFGLVIPNFNNPVIAEIINGAEAAAARLSCLLLTGSTGNDGFQTGGFLDALEEGRVDGLLLAVDEPFEAASAQLEALGLPWLFLNRRTPHEVKRHVVLDDEHAAELAIQHLIGLGHRRIAHLGGPSQADTAIRRRAGYECALVRFGLPLSAVVCGDYSSAGGDAAMDQLLGGETQPTAIFVANIASAIGALHGARRLGRRVPEDLSIVAMHDLPLACYMSPPLTTVRMPLEELGARGVELLASTRPSDLINEVLRGPVELIVRGSTASPAEKP